MAARDVAAPAPTVTADGEPPARFVEVAIDAAGPGGGQTYTYHVPPRHSGLAPGELVLVEYGRRQALGVVLAVDVEPPERETKPVLSRVRSDGPLLPPLQLVLARHISQRYVCPPALVVRQMLPPNALESVELFARPLPGTTDDDDSAGDDVLDAVRVAGDDGIPADELPRGAGRAALLRHLRTLAGKRQIELSWRVRPAQPNVRLERFVGLSEAGETAARSLAAAGGQEQDQPAAIARLGQRQRAVLAELLAAGEPLPAARLAERHGGSALPGLLRRRLVELETVRVERNPLAGRATPERGTRPPEAELSREQSGAVGLVRDAILAGRHEALLLEGPTASGKSAVYSAAIAAALENARGALVLVPEIALALPLLERLAHDLGASVAVVHSGLSEGERADEWRRIRGGDARVVVGTRLAVLAPLADPGVVIVDEEHDAAYKSDRTPRLQARDVALELGRLAGAPVVLGSATPDVVSVGRARQGQLAHVPLGERLAGQLPEVSVIDLRRELAEGNRGLISRPLAAALHQLDTDAGERAILVMNRRGSASVVLCRDCGYVQICPECQRPLVFHASSLALRCHHCGAGAPVARRCPACGSVRIRYLGGGTERVEREVSIRFQGLRVGRLDRDVAERKGAAARVVDAFTSGELDVLVGTTLVTKGLDVPEVTLVGVVSADIALNLPDERAAERTYQLLAQAVGRAGRGDRPGRAFIQTYLPDHPAIRAAATHDASDFYEDELESRRRFRSPPFGELVKLTVAVEDRAAAEKASREMAERLRERARGDGHQVEVLGPVPAYVARRGGRWRFHVVLRGDGPMAVVGGDPGPPWSVDVDPESLL